MKKLYVVVLFLVSIYIFSQEAITSTLSLPTFPLSPNASQFDSYIDNRNVSHNTGGTNITIPIFNINQGLLNLPLSLDYTMTGIKVAQEASNLGLGWTLNYGGQVTRKINGIIDDAYQYGAEGCGGVIYSKYKLSDYAVLDPEDFSNPIGVMAKICYDIGFYDTQLDDYSYSTPTSSNKFIYNEIDKKFETTITSLDSIIPIFKNKLIDGWKIIDSKGIIYIYGH